MVKEVEHMGKTYYQCKRCKFYYKTKDLAKRCEEYCKRLNACDTTIIKHAVELK